MNQIKRVAGRQSSDLNSRLRDRHERSRKGKVIAVSLMMTIASVGISLGLVTASLVMHFGEAYTVLCTGGWFVAFLLHLSNLFMEVSELTRHERTESGRSLAP